MKNTAIMKEKIKTKKTVKIMIQIVKCLYQ